MNKEHPITPPPDLVEQWRNQAPEGMGSQIREMWIATQAARWGADQELEACCEWLKGHKIGDDLRRHRRPKPPSLKEQALQELERTVTLLMPVTGPNKVERFAIIRRALESLPE